VHPFPGNVRELENMMRRLALTASGPQISGTEMREALNQQSGMRMPAPASLGASMTGAPQNGLDQAAAIPMPAANARLSDSVEAHLQRYFDLHGDALPPPGLYDRILREIERPLLQVALDATGGNQLRCADLLGINRNTLRKKLTELNIEVTRRRKLM
jgi:two-component system, NtrC family, nitrogen regulation response regulator GlnG